VPDSDQPSTVSEHSLTKRRDPESGIRDPVHVPDGETN